MLIMNILPKRNYHVFPQYYFYPQNKTLVTCIRSIRSGKHNGGTWMSGEERCISYWIYWSLFYTKWKTPTVSYSYGPKYQL